VGSGRVLFILVASWDGFGGKGEKQGNCALSNQGKKKRRGANSVKVLWTCNTTYGASPLVNRTDRGGRKTGGTAWKIRNAPTWVRVASTEGFPLQQGSEMLRLVV